MIATLTVCKRWIDRECTMNAAVTLLEYIAENRLLGQAVLKPESKRVYDFPSLIRFLEYCAEDKDFSQFDKFLVVNFTLIDRTASNEVAPVQHQPAEVDAEDAFPNYVAVDHNRDDDADPVDDQLDLAGLVAPDEPLIGHRFIDGKLHPNQALLTAFRMKQTITVKLGRKSIAAPNIVLRCRYIFQSVPVRDDYHLKMGSNYSLVHPSESRTVLRKLFRCKYRRSCDKWSTCNSYAAEFMFLDSGLIFFYEAIHNDELFRNEPGQFTRAHVHAPTTICGCHKRSVATPCVGLSAETKKELRKLIIRKNKPKAVAISSIRGIFEQDPVHPRPCPYPDSQLEKYIIKLGRSPKASQESGVDYALMLREDIPAIEKRMRILQPDISAIVDPIVYQTKPDPCIFVSNDDWIKNLNSPAIFIDITYPKVKAAQENGEKTVFTITLCAGDKTDTELGAKDIKPIAIATCLDESMATLKTFFIKVCEYAISVGLDIKNNGEEGRGGGKYYIPNLKMVCGDGQVGLFNLVRDLFGTHIVRGLCYFHWTQTQERALKRMQFSPHVQGYMKGVIRNLSLMPDFASFCLELDCCIDQIMNKVKRAQNREIGENVRDWLEGEKIVKFLLDAIKSPDSNAWSVGTGLVNGLGKFRSTLAEPFNCSIQRAYKRACGIADDRSHFEAVLYKDVLVDLHARYLRRSGGATNNLNINVFRRAQLQLAQYRKFYGPDGFKLRVSKRFAVSFATGRPITLPDHRFPVRMEWEDDGSNVPKIIFKDLAEHALSLNGHCIVEGELRFDDAKNRWVMPGDWVWTAKGSCCEFVDNGSDPCTHICILYLMYSLEKPEGVSHILWSDKKVEAELATLLNRLNNYKNNRSYRFPGNHAKYGKDFMELTACRKIAEIRSRIEDDDKLYRTLFTREGDWLRNVTRKSKTIGLLLTNMKQPDLFKEVVDKYGHEFPEGKQPAKRITYQQPIHRDVRDVDSEPRPPTQFQKERAIGRAGGSQAQAMDHDDHIAMLYIQRPKKQRT